MNELFPVEGRQFVLDTNIFVEAKNEFYAMDICPGFWTCLIHLSQADRVVSIDQVLKEIRAYEDDLTEWAKAAPGTLFRTTRRSDIANAYRDLMDWVWRQSRYRKRAKLDFARAADGCVTAYAKVEGAAVVTQETFSAVAQRRVPLPNPCAEFEIDCLRTFDMLRESGVAFEWSGTP